MTEKPTNARIEKILTGIDPISVGLRWYTGCHNGTPVPDYEHDLAAAVGALESVLNDETVCCTITLMKDAAAVILTKSKSVSDLSAKRIGVGENQRLPAAITAAILAACEKEAGRVN